MTKHNLIRAPLKYLQGKDALLDFYQETKELGNSFLFVCSGSGHKGCHEKIEKSFEGTDAKLDFQIFGGICSNGEIDKMRKIIKTSSIEAVVGVGGGSAIDTAKAAAHYEGIPVIIVPTVCATDAPCTGLSVIYNDDGSFDRYVFYPRNPECVIVDTAVIANAPVEFLVAGMGDALGTYFEARACVRTTSPSLEGGGVSRSAMALCELCYETLLEYGYQAKLACENHLVTPAFDAIVEANTYLSGVGADNGGLALAHSVYNGFTALQECEKTMHGSLVAFGTIVQLIVEEAEQEELFTVINFCKEVGLPVTLAQVGVRDPGRVRIAAEKACVEGETIHHMSGDVTPEQFYDAVMMADLLGKEA